jgi:hypothetical protein
MKNYEVEIKERYSHGCYGKETFFGLILSADSCKEAETFAEDILYDMTYQEFFERCHDKRFPTECCKRQYMFVERRIRNEDGTFSYKYEQKNLTDKLGSDHTFTIKARIFKG